AVQDLMISPGSSMS
nr:immunoglobulin heavy chain junction region [Mus musculus]